MTSRFQVGAMTLAAVALAIGGTAAAQRLSRFHEILKEAQERRSQIADPNLTPISAPGNYRFTFVHDGLRRDYLVHVPRSYAGAPTAMLLALHGGGGNADLQADDSRYGLISKSERAGFILVFPNGYSRFASGVLATWNAGACCGAAQKNKVDDVGFLREVIERAKQQLHVDPDRVFVTGMSNGALMSWRLACEASDLIRGIAPVEGTDNTSVCTPSRPVPIIEFHAFDDDFIPLSGGHGARALTDTNFASVAATQAKWVALDRADTKTVRMLTVAGAHCDLHRPRPGGAPVELCLTDGGGHSWPGGGTDHGRKHPSTAISANDLMWNFFSSL